MFKEKMKKKFRIKKASSFLSKMSKINIIIYFFSFNKKKNPRTDSILKISIRQRSNEPGVVFFLLHDSITKTDNYQRFFLTKLILH